jgi:transcriptional regulator with XRE-family HTH domain
MDDSKQPHAIDVAVGSRVRRARVDRGLSQGALAERVGVTFQQVQKYENGSNRISASKLVEIADTLLVAPEVFLRGLGQAQGETVSSVARPPGAEDLVTMYAELPPPVRESVLQIVRSLLENFERPARGLAPRTNGSRQAPH